METPAEFDQPHVAGTTVDGRQRETRSHHRAVFLLCTCCLLLPVLLGVMAVRNLTMARSLELQYMSLKSRAASVLGQTCVHLGFGDTVSEKESSLSEKKRATSEILQLKQQLEATLVRHCENTTGLCLPGPKGNPGTTGSSGGAGTPGPRGVKGTKGLPGFPGSVGPRGLTGSLGLPGAKGTTGERGESGWKGDRGMRGLPGQKGRSGHLGRDGLAGRKGARGEPGLQGLPGDKGREGLPGEKGLQGTHGAIGEEGETGVKGQPGSSLGRQCLCRLPTTSKVVSSCDFEQDSCGWTRPSTTYGWRRGGFPRQSDFTGPSTDHTMTHTSFGHYMYTNAFFGLSEMTSALTSQPMTGGLTYCLEIWYFLHGQLAGSIGVGIQKQEHNTTPLWEVSGDQGDVWQKARVSVTSPDDFRLVVTARFGGHFTSDVFVDDVTVLEGACT